MYHGEASEQPLVSIIITNFNYAHYLPFAIASALGQTYPNIEVIVVDDGSTDKSRQIIAGFGDRVIPVSKENGGMGSAINAGYLASKGSIVAFLDADDAFLPEKIERVVATWREYPDANVVYHQLKAIDHEGNWIWNGKPWPKTMLKGAIHDHVERSGGWWPWPVTSGLAFSRDYLDRVLPVPENAFRGCADAYFAGLAPFLGPVVGIDVPLSLYRLHGANLSARAWPGPQKSRQAAHKAKAERYAIEFDRVRETLIERLGVPTSMSLDDHYLYQYYARSAGEPIPLYKVIRPLVTCKMLPRSFKVNQLAKILLRRPYI